VRRTLLALALVVAGFALGRADGSGWPSFVGERGLEAQAERTAPGRRPARVERVVDGDTVVIADLGSSRLIGVDTPEVFGGAECFGREASNFAKRVLQTGDRVSYRLGVEPRDRYGRELVYLWLEDGRMFNALLIERGYAQILTIPPNVEYAERFRRLAARARRDGVGLWTPGACR
jgi:micrococcal nuclease